MSTEPLRLEHPEQLPDSGQCLRLPGIELHLGDCREGLAGLGAHAVDHAIQDPPYEDEVHARGRRLVSGSFAAQAAGQRAVINRPIEYAPMTDEERRDVGRQVARVTRRWILNFCQVEGGPLWRAAFEGGGAEYVRTGSWHKTDAQPQLTGDRPGQGWEAVIICHGARGAGGAAATLPLLGGLERQHAGRMRWNGGGRCATWRGPSRDTGGDLTRKKLVQGQKPLWLIEKMISDYTDPGELVADFYAGSGTAAIACMKLGRRFIGWEKDPGRFAIARQRIESFAAGQLQLLGGGQ